MSKIEIHVMKQKQMHDMRQERPLTSVMIAIHSWKKAFSNWAFIITFIQTSTALSLLWSCMTTYIVIFTFRITLLSRYCCNLFVQNKQACNNCFKPLECRFRFQKQNLTILIYIHGVHRKPCYWTRPLHAYLKRLSTTE
jgi:hypothetical protein